ncbi:MAG: type II secretion system F family protein [Parcubacteria group bacterium]|nr:type II secretion system F family protein [Parcubacteria group bacterium]
MLFQYKVINQEGKPQEGSIDALNEEVAINSLQRRGLTVVSVTKEKEESFFEKQLSFFERVSVRDVVILSRQVSTLFTAEVSALRVFRLLAGESENPNLRKKLGIVADDIQGGSSISDALSKHPSIFSPFYVNLVRAGEEAGKLNEAFSHLADYLDRSYELTIKTRNALIYPAFVIATFVVVMILMLTMVIPRLSAILFETGQEIPIYTKIVVSISDFFVSYGILVLILLLGGGIALGRFVMTPTGRHSLDRFKISAPFFGKLFQKLYLARIADNMHTMLTSGISMVKGLEITASIVGNVVYEDILKKAAEDVKGGDSVSNSFGGHRAEIPNIMVQIIKVGEETGELGNILRTLSAFYEREVRNVVDTLVGLIEPVLIVGLGLGVGLLLTSVLIPIYNISSGF